MDKMLDMIGRDRVAKGLYWTKAWSLIEGCTPVSEGCAHCWSAAQTHMRKGQANSKIKVRYSGLTTDKGCFNGKVRLMDETLDLPLKTRKPTVWAVWNDFFHPSVTLDFQAEALSVMRRCPQHIFLILTKREKQLATFNYACGWSAESYPNIWLGVTVESPEYLYRIDELLKVDAVVRWVSIEPMLGAIDLNPYLLCPKCGYSKKDAGIHCDHRLCNGQPTPSTLDWVVCGGETGAGARPMKPDWPRRVCQDCKEAGVPFFLKSNGIWIPDRLADEGPPKVYRFSDGMVMSRTTKAKAGRFLDGKIWSQLPEVKA